MSKIPIFCLFFTANLYERTENHFFKIGDRVRLSKNDLPLRKGYQSQFLQNIFEVVAIATRKPPTYTIKNDQDEIIRGKFYQRELIKVI